jgi:hypothetical protein
MNVSDINIGRFGKDLYKMNADSSHPNNEKWKQLHKPSLLVGRGTGTVWWTHHLKQSDKLIIPVDNFGGVFKGEEDHLWMDFNNTTALEMLPRNWVDKLMFDYSTWRYMKTESEILQRWKAILRIDSEICFEHGVSSIRINEGLGGDICFESNPSHIIISSAKLHAMLREIPYLKHELRLFVANIMDSGNLNRLFLRPNAIIIPAKINNEHETLDVKSKANHKRIFYSLVKAALSNHLFELYQKVFNSNGFSHVKLMNGSFPVAENGIKEWVQVKFN